MGEDPDDVARVPAPHEGVVGVGDVGPRDVRDPGLSEDLRVERDSLSMNLLALQNVEEENLRLRSLMQLSQRVAVRFKAANLYPARRSGEIVARSFRLDVGREDDVTPDAPVVAPGVVSI